MTIINARWPRDLAPVSCKFTRDRNDILQVSPRSRETHVIRQSRPLWTAELSWRLPEGNRLARLRRILDGLEGYGGSVQLWDFAAPYPGGFARAPVALRPGPRYWLTPTSALRTFTFLDARPLWRGSSVQKAAAAAAIGDYSISVNGLAASAIAVTAGQYVQAGRRLYLAAKSVKADATGAAVIVLTSPLLSAVVAGDWLRTVEAACEMRLDTQSIESVGSAGEGYGAISARFIETITDLV